MYLLPVIKVLINNHYNFTSVLECNVEKSIDTIGSKAIFKIPVSARLRSDGVLQSNSIQTAVTFKRGQPINIKMGFDDGINDEFNGFIANVGAGTPTVIECEGFEYLLRDKVPPKTFTNANLKDIIEYVVNGKLTINSDIPSVTVQDYVIKAGATALAVLQKLKEYYLLTININNDKLFVGLREQQNLGEIKYYLNGENRNVISDSDLKFKTAEEKKYKVKAVVFSKDNTKKEYQFGDEDGEERTLHFYDNQSNLEELVKNELNRVKYTGFEGKMKTFGLPFAQPCNIANINDSIYSERTGKYYIVSINAELTTGGFRRTVELGCKISSN